MSSDPAGFLSGRGLIILESYDEDGAPRQTPMEAVGRGSLLHARTDPLSNKVKRIRGNPHVRVAVSDMSGKPKGPWAEGEARIVEGEDMAEAVKAFRREYGTFRYTLINAVGRLKGQRLSSVMCINIGSNSDDGKE